MKPVNTFSKSSIEIILARPENHHKPQAEAPSGKNLINKLITNLESRSVPLLIVCTLYIYNECIHILAFRSLPIIKKGDSSLFQNSLSSLISFRPTTRISEALDMMQDMGFTGSNIKA